MRTRTISTAVRGSQTPLARLTLIFFMTLTLVNCGGGVSTPGSAAATRTNMNDLAPGGAANTSAESEAGAPGHAPGSYARALELWEGLRNFQFSVEVTTAGGKRRTYIGERVQRNGQTVIHVTISGAGRDDDGEWWLRLGNNPFDNGQRVYRREAGNWVRMQSPPDTEMILPAGGTVSPLTASHQTLVGTETLGNQQCNHFHRSDDEVGVIDTWISRTTGFAIRKSFRDTSGNVTVNDIARPNEEIQIEMPAGME